MKDYPYERYVRDSRIMMIFEGTNEILRLFISLMGVQHAGMELKDVVMKLRNPLFNPGFALKFLFQEMRHRRENPKLNLQLKGYVHPSLEISANHLEYSILRFQFGVRQSLQRHGKGIINAQLDLARLADCATHIYAAFASLSRASRAYCIGLHNATHELELAATIVGQTRVLVHKNIRALAGESFDQAHLDIGKKVFEQGGYYPVHPLSKNFI